MIRMTVEIQSSSFFKDGVVSICNRKSRCTFGACEDIIYILIESKAGNKDNFLRGEQ